MSHAGATPSRVFFRYTGFMVARPLSAPEFAAKLRTLREAKGWNQSELARRMDLKSSAQISRYEKGDITPEQDTLSELAKVLEVPLSTFYGDPDSPLQPITVEEAAEIRALMLSVVRDASRTVALMEKVLGQQKAAPEKGAAITNRDIRSSGVVEALEVVDADPEAPESPRQGRASGGSKG
jgi:transcriptional regulator with XRE-family HTH domain